MAVQELPLCTLNWMYNACSTVYSAKRKYIKIVSRNEQTRAGMLGNSCPAMLNVNKLYKLPISNLSSGCVFNTNW